VEAGHGGEAVEYRRRAEPGGSVILLIPPRAAVLPGEPVICRAAGIIQTRRRDITCPGGLPP